MNVLYLDWYLRHLGTSLVSMFSTSPVVHVKPLDIELLIALNGGHWLPIDETFSTGSIRALAYGTERSKIRFNVVPQRSYNCVCLIAGVTDKTKSILTTFSSRSVGIALMNVTFTLTLIAEQRCDNLSLRMLSYCASRSLYWGKQAFETAPSARYWTLATTWYAACWVSGIRCENMLWIVLQNYINWY